MEIRAKKILPTLKINPKKTDVNAVKFNGEMQGLILNVDKISTKYGERFVLHFREELTDKEYAVFLNNLSISNLTSKLGTETEMWKNKFITLSIEQIENFDKEAIVVRPIAV